MSRMFLQASSTARIVFLCVALLGSPIVLAAETAVSFDVPAIAVSEAIDPGTVPHVTVGSKLVRIRVPVSTRVYSSHRGAVDEVVVQLSSPYLTMRVVDFWPKTEVYSDIEGTVLVKHTAKGEGQLGAKGSLGYQPLGVGNLEAGFKKTSSQEESFQRKPQTQVVSSSGTISRGHGAFFKFRPGGMDTLEGVQDVAILVEVPQHWRADMLHVSVAARGDGSRGKTRLLGQARMWSVVYQAGDRAAAAQASRYVTQERALRVLAASSREAVKKKSLPSVWHKLGAAFDMVDPKIPEDYLSQVIFSSKNRYYDHPTTNRLPVDLRVAILDYWEERERLLGLSQGSQFTGVLSQPVARNTASLASTF